MSISRSTKYPYPNSKDLLPWAKDLHRALSKESVDRLSDFDWLQQNNAPVVDIRSFGAKGDGTTDDRVSIKAASDSLTLGGILYIPPGDYLTTASIEISNNNVIIMGAGWDSRVFTTSDDDLFIISGDGCGCHYMMLEGSGNIIKDGSDLDSQLWVTGNDFHVSDCYIYKVITFGISIYGGLRAIVKNNYIEGEVTGWTTGTDHAGIGLYRAVKASVDSNVVDKCVMGILIGQYNVGSIDDDGEDSSETRDATITNNKIYRFGNNGIYQTIGHRNTFSGNVIKTSTNGSGFRVHGDGNIIVNNEIYDMNGASGNGITVADPTNVIVDGNYIDSPNLRGIVINRTTSGVIEDVTITNNNIYNAGNRGIQVVETSATNIARIKINDNTIEDSALEGIRLVFTSDYSGFSICDNTVHNSDGHGIRIQQVVNSIISNNVVSNSGQAGDTKDGISINNCDENVISGNRCFDDGGTKYQAYGIQAAGTSDHNYYFGNQLRGNLTGEITGTGTNSILVPGTTTKELNFEGAVFERGSTAPTSVIVGNYQLWEYDINDDSVFLFEVPEDWIVGTDFVINLDWCIDRPYGTENGEVRWQILWSAIPDDGTEAINAPGSTGTLDSGDINIPATNYFYTETVVGTISGSSITEHDEIGFTLSRIALVGGNDPGGNKDPLVGHIHVDYTADDLGGEGID